jgi:hypothetical protein
VQPGMLHKPTSLKFKNSAKNLKKPSKPSSVDLKQEGSQRKPRSRVDFARCKRRPEGSYSVAHLALYQGKQASGQRRAGNPEKPA